MISSIRKWIGDKSLFATNGRSVLVRYDSSPSSPSPEKLGSSHKVDNLEKRFLVWTGKYKSKEEVPDFVSQSVMERARNRMRIKVANYMMVATLIGCIIMAYLGKQDAKRGDSLVKQNLEWHKQQEAKSK